MLSAVTKWRNESCTLPNWLFGFLRNCLVYQNKIHRTLSKKCTSNQNGSELGTVNESIEQSLLKFSVLGSVEEAQ